MQDILTAVYSYCESHSKCSDPILEELEKVTHLQTTQPRMLSGPLQGSFLQLISKISKPQRILEIGTFTGYSAICLAKGLEQGGKLITIDINPETLAIARKYVEKSGLLSSIEIIEGNALDVISGLNEMFDIVFIDADKENYPSYYTMVKPKIRKGGLIILDNMLWSGKVLDDNMDARTKALHQLNQILLQDPDVENLLLPLRDGLHIAIKIT